MKKKATTLALVSPADVGARAARILLGARPEDRMSKDERVSRARADIGFFQRYYLADYFNAEPALFHEELNQLAMTCPRGVFAAPREHAKSTVLSFSVPLHAIVFKRRRFVVIFRESDTIGQQNVDEIREELEGNERIREDFGNLVGGRKWTGAEFITSHGVKCLARGRDAAARGLRYKQFRPDLVIVDDFEDDQSVENKNQRDKLERKINRVILNTIAPDGQFLMLGTILHHDSVLVRMLAKTKSFTTRVWRCGYSEGKTLWPARWPLSRLEAKLREIGQRDFNTEFENNPANEEDQIFSPNNWKTFRDEDVQGKLLTVAAIDPAIGLKQKNDDTAIAVVAERNGNFYVLSIMLKKLKIQAQVDTVFATFAEYPMILKFGFETIAYQSALKQLVDDRSARDRVQLPAVAVDDIHGDKILRISRLAPMAEQGRIYWPHPNSAYWTPDVEKCKEEFEALGCSSNSHDDGPDAVERAIALLRKATGMKSKVSVG